jgi:hypothetical protein
MSLTLITGRANTGKTGRVLDIYRDRLSAGNRPVLILPSRPDADRIANELVQDLTLGVDVTTFDGFVASRWAESGDGRRIITPTQRRVLLASSSRQTGGRGLTRLAARAVQHLASGGEEWRRLGPMSGDAAEIAGVIRSYADELERRGLIEAGEASGALAQSLGPGDAIIFHRFSDLTLSQESFVRGADERGADVILTLTWEEGFAPTEALDALVVRLVDRAVGEHLPSTEEHMPDPELRRIEAELFTGPEPRSGDGAVSFLMGEGPEAEADIIAGQTRRLIDDGIPAERIAVVYRELRGRAGLISRAFGEAGVRIDLDMTQRFDDIPFGRAFTQAVSFLAGGGRADLLGLIRSGYLCAVTAAVQRLIHRWLGEGVFETRALLAGVEECGDWQGRLFRAALDEDLHVEKRAQVWDELATRMLAQRRSCRPSEGQLALDARARAGLTRVLEDLRSLEGTRVDAVTLLTALEEYSIGVRRVERPGCVQVTSAERVRGRRFEAVVLGGLNSGEFPLVSEDPLACDALAPLWEGSGVRPPARREPSAERALLYSVLTRPRRKLLVSRLIAGAGGEDVGPSVFWEELRDFYRDPCAEEQPDLVQDRVLRLHETGLAAHAASSLRAGLREQACREPQARNDASSARLDSARWRTRRTGDRVDEKRLAELARPESFSPSALEIYSRCPYRWFITRAVGDKGIEFEVDVLLEGSVSHRALEIFYSGKTRTRPVDAATDEELSQLAREALEEAVVVEGVPLHERAALVSELVPGVVRSLRSDADFLPGYAVEKTEWSFGGEDHPRVEFGPFSLRGRVDRIDASGTSAVVIDYKRGSVAGYAASKLEETKSIQAPLYAYAVETALEMDVHGALYRGLTDGKTRGVADCDALPTEGLSRNDLVSPAEYRSTIEWAVGEATRAAEGIRAGRIDRSGGDHCEYCPVSGWCEASER